MLVTTHIFGPFKSTEIDLNNTKYRSSRVKYIKVNKQYRYKSQITEQLYGSGRLNIIIQIIQCQKYNSSYINSNTVIDR